MWACNICRLLNGLHCGNIQHVNGVECFKRPNARPGLSIKTSGKVKSALFSTENGSLPRSPSSDVTSNALVSDISAGVELQPDSVILGALSADMAPASSGFPVDNDEFDLDMPSEGFSTIPEAIEDIRNGKVYILL